MSDDQKKNDSRILATSIKERLSKHRPVPPLETDDKTEEKNAAPQRKLRTMGWFHTPPKVILKTDDDSEVKTPEP